MSSLKDIQYMLNGEPTPTVKPEEEYVPKGTELLKEPKKEKGFVVFKLKNSNRKGGVHIPAIDHVIDARTITKEKPHGNGPEKIRLLTGVPTIWVKEQKDISEEFVRKNQRTIEWPRGSKFYSVPAWDLTLLEFMRVCRYNISSPNRLSGSKIEFFEYDPTAIAKERMKKELLEMEMVIKASKQSFEKMKKHAFFLKISLTDELGRAKEEPALRVDYLLAAKRDPEMFKRTVDSKEVDVQFKIRAAIIDNKIDVSRQKGKAYWGNNGELICSYTGTALEALTNLALQQTTEGKEFLERLNTIQT